MASQHHHHPHPHHHHHQIQNPSHHDHEDDTTYHHQKHHHHQHQNHHHQHQNHHENHQTLTQERRREGKGGRRGGGGSYRSAGALRAPRGVALLLVVLSVLGTAVPGRALCEDRCERVVPMLSRLRALWSRSFKRVGEKRISFEEFMVSLVQASSNTGHSRVHRLGNALLNLIGQYQDCVMACEHPFSKRGADTAPSRQRSKPSLKHLCDRIYSIRHTSPLLGELCMTYGP